MSTGWNNHQNASRIQYNEWVENLKLLAKSDGIDFKPFIIGLTWPSFWGKINMIDVANKANDADELGLTHINYLIWKGLLSKKIIKSIPVIFIGHSFGARILTRAAYSKDYFVKSNTSKEIDLIFALQGAYPVDRHLNEDGRFKSINLGLYTQTDSCKRFVGTMSKGDTAMNTARFFGGGMYIGDDKSETKISNIDSNPFEFNQVDSDGIRDKNYNAGKLELVDCDELIDSHGDVGKFQVCKMMWEYIKEIN